MLELRKEHTEALSAYMSQRFEDRMVQHLGAAFPERYQRMSEADSSDRPIRELIQKGIKRARHYGIRSERDICHYVELMLVVDPKFETFPQMKWIQKILSSKSVPDDSKMGVIHQQLPTRHPDIEPFQPNHEAV